MNDKILHIYKSGHEYGDWLDMRMWDKYNISLNTIAFVTTHLHCQSLDKEWSLLTPEAIYLESPKIGDCFYAQGYQSEGVEDTDPEKDTFREWKSDNEFIWKVVNRLIHPSYRKGQSFSSIITLYCENLRDFKHNTDDAPAQMVPISGKG